MSNDPDLGTDLRVEPPPQADERTTLTAFLRSPRDTLELKCAGLDATGGSWRRRRAST